MLPKCWEAFDTYRFRPGDLLGTTLKCCKPKFQSGSAVLRRDQRCGLRPAGNAFSARQLRRLPVIISGILADNVVLLLMSAGMSDTSHAKKHAKSIADVQPL